jgi:hypothetical protein
MFFTAHVFSCNFGVISPEFSVLILWCCNKKLVLRSLMLYDEKTWTSEFWSWYQGWYFFSYFTDFSYFFCEKKKDENCNKLSEQLQNDLSERGCRWFQLFHFLIRIISLILKCTDWFSFHTRFNNCIRRFMLSDLLKHIKIKLIFQQLNKNNTAMKPDTPFDLSRWGLSILILLLILWLYHIFFLEKSMYIVL